MQSQCVVITAGASGIGYATATRFLADGASVAICDIDAKALTNAKSKHPELLTAVVDVSDSAAVDDYVLGVADQLGSIDVLINNAGIAGPTADIVSVSDDDWVRSFDVNIHGAFYMLRSVLPHMKARGAGAVVNISTSSTFTLPLNRSPYIASKWAVEGLTRAAARELGSDNIRVNAIRPGIVDGDRMRRVLGEIAKQQNTTIESLEKDMLGYVSMQCKIQPEEIGDMAVFLASDRAKHITGQLVAVDGNIEWE